QVETAESGERCLEMMGKGEYQALFLDVWMPGRDGLDVLTEISQRASPPAVVMISGHGTIESAVRAAKIGAYDFIEKPLSLEKVTLTLRNALKQRRLEEKNRLLKEELSQDETLVGDSPPIRKLREEIALAAPTNGRVLILGENGTGKELVARLIHSSSLRREEPFIEVNCAAIPEELIESELFGHVRGAFTGAVESKRGKFELADGGTILLDEIGDMSLRTQAKVLRVLQEQTFEPVGGSSGRQVDVRVIAATNKDIPQAIARGEFREDLYFRLNVIPLKVPPLRKRREDIPALTRHFLERFGSEYARRREMSRSAMEALERYDWPGNVRELRNTLERMVIMTGHPIIQAEDLPAAVRGRGGEGQGGGWEALDGASLKDARAAFEKDFILRKLEEVGGSVARAAEVLQIERSHLYRKLSAFGIKTPKR
ncbi:MAG TPA: sigma-54 dependent transcriptional regulator, partial [Candidatus Polarisedimenticolia bacterium]|nr:sigma-54 dependent transcriptional regulator [Candidatus Polarisedimenticolia bacterium]